MNFRTFQATVNPAMSSTFTLPPLSAATAHRVQAKTDIIIIIMIIIIKITELKKNWQVPQNHHRGQTLCMSAV